MKLISFILIFFTDGDNVGESFIIPGVDNLYTISLGNNILFDNLYCHNIVNKFTVPIIEYLQDIKFESIETDYKIPYMNPIPYIEKVYQLKDKVNKMFKEVDNLEDLIESVPEDDKYVVMVGIDLNEESGDITEFNEDDYNILSIKLIVNKINVTNGITYFNALEDDRNNLSSIKFLLEFLLELMEVKNSFNIEDNTSLERFINNNKDRDDTRKNRIMINYANRMLSIDELANAASIDLSEEESEEIINNYHHNEEYDLDYYRQLASAYRTMMNKYSSFKSKGVNISNISEATLFLNGDNFGVLPNDEVISENTNEYNYYYYNAMYILINDKMINLITEERNN